MFKLLSALTLSALALNHCLAADALRDEMQMIADQARGRVGVAMMVVDGAESAGLNPDQHFPMQSVYKFPIGMAALAAVDAGKIGLDDAIMVERSELIGGKQRSPIRDLHPQGHFEMTVKELLRYAVSESDGSASDVLLRLVGGPAKVMDYLATMGITDIRVVDTELELGRQQATQYRNWSTPKEAVRLLRAFYLGQGLKPESRALLMQLMTQTTTGPKRIKGLLPNGTVVAHKTGSSGSLNGIAAATNDIGLVGLPDGHHLAIAVFVADSQAGAAEREAVIARLARLGWDRWGARIPCRDNRIAELALGPINN